MISQANIAGGGNGTSGATKHLMNRTLSAELSQMPDYYNRMDQPDKAMVQAAYAIADGVPFSEALDDLVQQHIRSGGDLDQLLDWEERTSVRLSALADRVMDDRENGTDTIYAPVAVIRPDLHQTVADGLGIRVGDILSYQEVDALLAGRRADNEPIEGKTYAGVRHLPVDPDTGKNRLSQPLGSVDFTVSPHKSVSVAHGLSNDLERAMVENAHREASREAVAYLVDGIAVARVGDGGSGGSVKGHAAWLEFMHHTSRKVVENADSGVTIDPSAKADMDLHTHYLVVNAVFCDDGRVGSLDTAAIRGLKFEADMFYHARLSEKLREAGFDVALDHDTGAARMTAIPEDINRLFSKRTELGEELAKKWTADKGQDWDALAPEQRAKRIKHATQSVEQKQRGDKDGMSDTDDWRRQAKATGWEQPASFLTHGPPAPELAPELMHRQAYSLAIERLSDRLEQKAVLTHHDLRAAAFQALVETGNPGGLDDCKAVTRLMWDEGVLQNGEKTRIRFGQELDKRHISITTDLHVDQENEFVRLAKDAAGDRSLALTPAAIDAAAVRSGLDFTSKQNGRDQLKAIHQLGEGGRFGVVVGVAGSGKSAMVKVLAEAMKAQGRDIWVSSLGWVQTDAMASTGVDKHGRRAFSVLLKGLEDGSVRVNSRSVIAIDEFALLGTRQGLTLLREQEKHGFTIYAMGDNKQIRSIEAGAIVDLCRKALGPGQIPEILTTQRQQTQREQDAVRLLRAGKGAEFVQMKRDAGTIELVPGRDQDVINRAAKLYAERLLATGQTPSMATATNTNAQRIGEAVRHERRELGLIGPDIRTVAATDGKGHQYSLTLAQGDHIRLFQSTRAAFPGGKEAAIGRNGSVLEVMDVTARGLVLKAEDEKTGEVFWNRLRDKESGRTLAAYGHCLTVSSSQGSTRDEHIIVLPHGSKELEAGDFYSAGTRHRQQSFMLTSAMAEYVEVRGERARNDTREITDNDRFANIAGHLVPRGPNDLATDFMQRSTGIKHGRVKEFHEAYRPMVHRQALGQSLSDAPDLTMARRAAREIGVKQVALELTQTIQQTVQRGIELTRETGRYVGRGMGMSR